MTFSDVGTIASIIGTIASIVSLAKTEWRKAVVLEFIDDNGNGLWAFPSVEALNDLMSAVQYQAAGVKDFLTELLAS
jgi:hypothetical protein